MLNPKIWNKKFNFYLAKIKFKESKIWVSNMKLAHMQILKERRENEKGSDRILVYE